MLKKDYVLRIMQNFHTQTLLDLHVEPFDFILSISATK